jgi:hypothetical protein
MRICFFLVTASTLALTACQTAARSHYCGIPDPTPQPNPSGTAHDQFGGQKVVMMAIVSEPAGAVIELDGEYMGITPCTVAIPSTPAGTFAPGPLYSHTLTATPHAPPPKPGIPNYFDQFDPNPIDNQYLQRKVFMPFQKIPYRVYFNMTLHQVGI